MAGPTRRSPFDQADDGHQVYSPLSNLVRKASHNQKTGKIPTLSSLANTNGTTADYRPPNMRTVAAEQPPRKEKVVPPSLVLRGSSPEPAGTQGHRRAQPSSPLLHTRFRASVATSIGTASDRDSQELHYHHQPHSSGSDYTPSPTMHKPFAYVIDDTHAGSPTSQYSAPGSARLPLSPSQNQPFQFDARTSVAPSDVGSVAPPFQYDPRASSLTASTDAPFHYDDSKSNILSFAPPNVRSSTRSSTAYNPRGTWRSSAAPEPDPFSFRDYEAPRVEPPIVVVHSPMSTIQDNGDEDVDADFYLGEREDEVGSTSYHDAYEYVYGAIEAEEEEDQATETGHARYSQASEYTTSGYFAPEPEPESEPVDALPAAVSKMSVASGGRVASVVAGGARYNYSRPMRSGGGSISGTGAIQEPVDVRARSQSDSRAQPPLESRAQPSDSRGQPLYDAHPPLQYHARAQPQYDPQSQQQYDSQAQPHDPRAVIQPLPEESKRTVPVRKGTGPLIFQSTAPAPAPAGDGEYPYRYSPGPLSASEDHSTQSSPQATHQAAYSPEAAYSLNSPIMHSPQSSPQTAQAPYPAPWQQSPHSPQSQLPTPRSQYSARSELSYLDDPEPPRSQPGPTQPLRPRHPPTLSAHSSQTQLSSQYTQQSPSQSPSQSQSQLPSQQRPPSLYSQYSFYSLPNSTPPESPRATPPDQNKQLKPKPSGSSLNPNRSNSPSTTPIKAPTSAAQHYLHQGISAHESGNLRESARCFERSATEGGGCGVGMLMWGLSLRHGWGCRKDERTGFRWLRKAAEAAVSDLEGARSGEEAKAVKNELVLAIYEVGQCFFHGWGVGQDKTMAVSYFQVAARLGDCDAQQELAFCYLNGKGCKKDMKEAARWYRAAAAQGASTVGLAWIYKSKYT